MGSLSKRVIEGLLFMIAITLYRQVHKDELSRGLIENGHEHTPYCPGLTLPMWLADDGFMTNSHGIW